MAILAAGLFGAGIGSVLTLLPVAWADYFGRANYGAIRGLEHVSPQLSRGDSHGAKDKGFYRH